MNATNENLLYQAVLIETEYTQEDIDLLYSVLSPEEKEKLDKYRQNLHYQYRHGLRSNYKACFDQEILQKLVRAMYTLIDIARRSSFK